MADEADSGSVRVMDILRANGEEHLYDQVMQVMNDEKRAEEQEEEEADPILIVAWQHPVEAFVQAVNTAREEAAAPGGQPLPAGPLELPDQVTAENFKRAVLRCLGLQEASTAPGLACYQTSLSETLKLVSKLLHLDHSPWTKRVVAVGGPNILPIANVYGYYGNKELGTIILPAPGSLWGE